MLLAPQCVRTLLEPVVWPNVAFPHMRLSGCVEKRSLRSLYDLARPKGVTELIGPHSPDIAATLRGSCLRSCRDLTMYGPLGFNGANRPNFPCTWAQSLK